MVSWAKCLSLLIVFYMFHLFYVFSFLLALFYIEYFYFLLLLFNNALFSKSLVFTLEITAYIVDLLKYNEKWYYFPENKDYGTLFHSIYPFPSFCVIYFNSDYILNHIKHHTFVEFSFKQFYYYVPQYVYFVLFLL